MATNNKAPEQEYTYEEICESFKMYSEYVKTWHPKVTPSDEDKLSAYSYYKQATCGDCTGDRPSMLNIVGRAKYDAWNKHKGMDNMTAMMKYIESVQGQIVKYSQ